MNIIISILMISLSILSGKSDDYVSFEHVGISDKPIFSFNIIKKSIQESDTPDNYFISNENFCKMKKTLLLHKDNKYKGIEYGTFRISIHDSTHNVIVFCLNRKESILLFNDLIEILGSEKGNDALIARLEVTRRRIDF
jgi:hypothetical protein